MTRLRPLVSSLAPGDSWEPAASGASVPTVLGCRVRPPVERVPSVFGDPGAPGWLGDRPGAGTSPAIKTCSSCRREASWALEEQPEAPRHCLSSPAPTPDVLGLRGQSHPPGSTTRALGSLGGPSAVQSCVRLKVGAHFECFPLSQQVGLFSFSSVTQSV